MSDGPTLRTNPYRATAVADTGLIGHDPDAAEANVATAEQARALALLDGYLRAQPGQWTGLTMMVSGEYGSGKTHLLVRLLDKALAAVGEPVRALYVVAGRGGFLQLFHSVLDAVTKDELVRQLDQYYADEVAAELAATDVPHVRLSAGFEVDSEIYRRVHDRLTEVTDNRDFTTALWLLAKDKRMAEPVWRWLKGEEPAVSLTNRGIVHRIGTDIAAMEALGVLALVLGGRNRKFVLAIDELSGIFARSATPRNQLLEPFQTMLEIAKKSGSCFVLCGLPDLMESFDDGVKGRIDAHVRLPNFTRGEVVDLVLRSHERTLGRRVLAPLSEDGATAVHDYTRGNPVRSRGCCTRRSRGPCATCRTCPPTSRRCPTAPAAGSTRSRASTSGRSTPPRRSWSRRRSTPWSRRSGRSPRATTGRCGRS
ncbi:BREX system ATP-binding domain-containing protein [Actinokineospora soli]|uniref:BREX system ATP-binding domain-containing protein n=1 Tax=Actinokineospora soli TaxID=1048753 RepID=A0ABW2TT34_9PSEU